MRMSKKSSTFAAANKNKGLMKKYLLIAVACLSLVLGFSSCKVENSQVTVSVTDTEGAPVANRKVYYIDLASSIIDIFTPDPTDPLKEFTYHEKHTHSQDSRTTKKNQPTTKM